MQLKVYRQEEIYWSGKLQSFKCRDSR